MQNKQETIRVLSIGIAAVLKSIEEFEADATKSNIGAGKRNDGKKFEDLISELWSLVKCFCEQQGAESLITRNGCKNHVKLTVGKRSLYIPIYGKHAYNVKEINKTLDISFLVEDIINSLKTEKSIIEDYAPKEGCYAGTAYPKMYKGIHTKFDDTLVLEENNEFQKKILLEYKTAKSSKGKRMDGNAHERLTHQMIQYAKIVKADYYSKCYLVVITNGAYQRYRNKYHVSFNMDAELLEQAIPGFSCKFLYAYSEYTKFLVSLLMWLFACE